MVSGLRGVQPLSNRLSFATLEEPTSKDQKATSLGALGSHKPVIPVVTFQTPLYAQ
ncbi:hypothetical protein PFNF135_01324, partial [Plasmodium falciparum NF135/5.C10]